MSGRRSAEALPRADRMSAILELLGTTGTVHVGFVGPHKYLRNAGSN